MLVTKLWSRNEEGGPQGHMAVTEEDNESFLEAWKACLEASLDTSRANLIPWPSICSERVISV